METRVCNRCNEEKPVSLFYDRKRKLVNGTTKIYPRTNCKACSKVLAPPRDPVTDASIKARQKVWRDNNKDRCENARLKYRFGITLDTYKELLAFQNGTCSICKASKNTNSRNHKFHVDHCHKTEEVRGLLCNNCNVSLGGFRDSIELLEAAIKYLTDPPNTARLRDTGTPSDTV